MKRFQVYLEEPQTLQLERLARALEVPQAALIREGVQWIIRHKQRQVKDPLLDLVGLCDNPRGPRDVSVHHDRYLYGKRS